jgi:hypothetical protein
VAIARLLIATDPEPVPAELITVLEFINLGRPPARRAEEDSGLTLDWEQ